MPYNDLPNVCLDNEVHQDAFNITSETPDHNDLLYNTGTRDHVFFGFFVRPGWYPGMVYFGPLGEDILDSFVGDFFSYI